MGSEYEKFKDSLELALSLNRIERKYKNPPVNSQLPFVRGLRGGAAVLSVASFEFFLKNLFEHYLSILFKGEIDFDKLPDIIRIKAIYNSLDRSLKGPQFQEKKNKVDRLSDIIKTCGNIISKNHNPKAFSEVGGNPNGSVVKEKFKDIGINDIFEIIKTKFEKKWGKPESDNFIKEKLDEIVGKRHVVAHTADTLHITRKTENESIKFLKILAELLEYEIDHHVKDLIKKAKRSA